ncbi:MAG: glycosyltransferase [Oscillatoriophycideae cyanobacterium NC_groundwater_1537_Pr4_S-0.65um_50_18]|nr:glycosyltransferase [Oscillatoriophycideae cyanobacterium NC_groundwater_1537_Pr4_S-0.65um_50_18]
MKQNLVQTAWFQPCLLLLWIGIGVAVRLTHLTAKPPWTDEFATLVFSLGHSFETVPLDRAIALDVLMQPLQLPPQGSHAVTQYLFAEDVHPPLYFLLSNAWLQLFSGKTGLVSLGLARSLPALLGVAAIPASFGLSWLMLRSPLASHLTTALMAVSPFGVYLAQEARHYTLGILWVIASLGCLVVAGRQILHRRPLPAWLVGLWIIVNGLGIATHYFFILSLSAMALALMGLAIAQARSDRRVLLSSSWRSLYAVVLGTAIASAIWLPILQDIRSREITQWIQNVQPFNWLDLVNPLAQSLAAWVTMLVLLPLESDELAVAIAAGTIMVLFILWVVPQLWRGLRQQIATPQTGAIVQLMIGVVLGAIALFFFISYGLRADITRGARYSFVYFPAVILLLGTSLAALWTGKTKRTVGLVLVLGLLSSLTVVNNLGYRKYYRPDSLVPLMEARSQVPILIATTQNTLVQTGEIMGIGWQFLQEGRSNPPEFLLAHEPQNPCSAACVATSTLRQALAQRSDPIDLWLVNFHAPVDLDERRCQLDSQPKTYTSGYEYQLYHCN